MAIGRQYHTQQTHYLRAPIAYTDGTVTVGVLPAGAVVVGGGVVVTTAFNDSGADLIDIGTSADPDGLATDLDASAVGLKAADELATSNDLYSTSEVTITATYAGANADASAGAGIVYVEFLADNDK